MVDASDAISKGLIEYWDKKGRKKEEPKKQRRIGVNASVAAIEKKYGVDAEAAKKVFYEYNGNRAQISSLVAQGKALKTVKGMTRSQKEQVKKEKAKLKEQLKVVREKQKALRIEAKRIKNLNRARIKLVKQEKSFEKNKEALKRTNSRIKDLQKRLSDGKGDPAKIRELIKSAKERLGKQETRSDTLVKSMAETKSVIENKGIVESSNAMPFGLSECCGTKHTLNVKTFRELNEREKTVNWTKLNASFIENEKLLNEEVVAIINAEVDRISQKIEKELSAGEVAFIIGLTFYIYGKLKEKIKEVFTKAYNDGVLSASSETKTDIPKTPTQIKQQINLESEILATTIEENLNNETKSIVQNAVLVGVGAVAIAQSIRESLKKRAIQYADNTSGIVGKYVNVGRDVVFNKPELKIKVMGYQRSEVLDIRTCAMCRALDGRLVTADDPFAKLTQVHSNCRGVWLPIYDVQELLNTGIPKSIQDNFNLVGGYPVPNDFKQLKKPKNDN